MKKVILGILLIIGIVSCSDDKIVYNGITFNNYDEYTEYSLNNLKSPVILIGVDERVIDNIKYYTVYVKDNDSNIRSFSWKSNIANWIGGTYSLGDTIR